MEGGNNKVSVSFYSLNARRNVQARCRLSEINSLFIRNKLIV